ncbi:hypothetical protein E2C01_003952 [Portunus trituberculatus]|uniref:Uncharacterized protein n=1 Tax=Portunus trituberculatus TaxID=210409 RepID=A0A5B7CP85_PORTR|nr:hypothetical protein [Portunus trituberculatus]
MSTRSVAPCLPGQPRAHHLTPAAAARPACLTLMLSNIILAAHHSRETQARSPVFVPGLTLTSWYRSMLLLLFFV